MSKLKNVPALVAVKLDSRDLPRAIEIAAHTPRPDERVAAALESAIVPAARTEVALDAFD